VGWQDHNRVLAEQKPPNLRKIDSKIGVLRIAGICGWILWREGMAGF
jgi:hypothetical protein